MGTRKGSCNPPKRRCTPGKVAREEIAQFSSGPPGMGKGGGGGDGGDGERVAQSPCTNTVLQVGECADKLYSPPPPHYWRGAPCLGARTASSGGDVGTGLG